MIRCLQSCCLPLALAFCGFMTHDSPASTVRKAGKVSAYGTSTDWVVWGCPCVQVMQVWTQCWPFGYLYAGRD